MKKAILIVALVCAVISLMGCPTVNVPMLISDGNVGSKTGESGGTIILGLFGDANAGAIAAAKNGNITKIGVVDTRVKFMVGTILITVTTTVAGD